jgi:hypothetical protein
VFGKLYVAGGVTKRQAIERGWQFAKDLAISTKMTGLQIYQANLYAVGLVSLKQNNVTNTAGLQGAIESLSTTYARLRPTPNGDETHASSSFGDFLGSLWADGKTAYQRRSRSVTVDPAMIKNEEQSIIAGAVRELTSRFQGQADPIKALQLLDRTIQSATQVQQLHSDGYQWKLGYYSAEYTKRSSSVRDTTFLAKLSDLSFEIARVNPTVTAGANPDSEWVETLWEGGSIASAAVGLSEFFNGFARETAGSSRRYNQGEALGYAGALVKASQLIDEAPVREKFRNAVLLSSVANWGSDYVFDARQVGAQGLFNSPFSVLASTNDLQETANQLKKWQLLSEESTNASTIEYPFFDVTIENGRPVAIWWHYSERFYLDESPAGSSLTPSIIDDSGLATFSESKNELKIYRANGKIESYPKIDQSKPNRSILFFRKPESMVSDIDKQLAFDKNYLSLFVGDRIALVRSLQFNQSNEKFPTDWLDRLSVARDLAIQAAPKRFVGEVRQIWDSIIQHPLLVGAGLATMGGIHVFAPPVAVALDAAMMAFFGAKSIVHLGSFFIKAIGATNQSELKSASDELLNFVNSAIEAATSGLGVFAANKISKGAALSEVGTWLARSATSGFDYLKLFGWDDILAIRSSSDALKSFFWLPALRSMNRSDVTSFLQYGKDAAVSFLASDFSDPLQALKSIGDKWDKFGKIVQRLDELPAIANALGQYPRNLSGVLNAGIDGINAIQSRAEIMGDLPVLWAKRFSLMDSPLEVNRTLEGLSYITQKRQELVVCQS